MTERHRSPDGGDLAAVLTLADRAVQASQDDAVADRLARSCRGRAWLGEIPSAQEAVVGV
ncbi:hypothetical protein ACFFWC_23160 [Plantactinospora siamensis]|uniref:Uncharacterized protein n=1 Tax=Plantactinospora siamensis TaxID=555372 RepID=A0ABV6NUA2_9ACTN